MRFNCPPQLAKLPIHGSPNYADAVQVRPITDVMAHVTVTDGACAVVTEVVGIFMPGEESHYFFTSVLAGTKPNSLHISPLAGEDHPGTSHDECRNPKLGRYSELDYRGKYYPCVEGVFDAGMPVVHAVRLNPKLLLKTALAMQSGDEVCLYFAPATENENDLPRPIRILPGESGKDQAALGLLVPMDPPPPPVSVMQIRITKLKLDLMPKEKPANDSTPADALP